MEGGGGSIDSACRRGLKSYPASQDDSMLFRYTVSEERAGERLDVFLAGKDLSMTRSQIKKSVEETLVRVNDLEVKTGHRLKKGDIVTIAKKAPREDNFLPEDIPLDIMYEDSHIIVIEKPAGMVVHPAAGNYEGTLVNALLHHCSDLSGIGGVMRPGIVHRLDKDTSGLIVVAKSDMAHLNLRGQFDRHEVIKIYKALVLGDVNKTRGVIERSIGRHPRDRKRMSISSPRGKPAVSCWKVVRRYGSATLLDVRILTGRTHQIRVHLNSIGYPIVGDSVYGSARKRINSIKDDTARIALKSMRRQALHAGVISFCHPVTSNQLEFRSSLPKDMASLCETLEERVPHE